MIFITEKGYKHLNNLRNLSKLNLFGCTGFGNSSLVFLRELTKLIDLNLSETSITGAGLSVLDTLQQLEKLDLKWRRNQATALLHSSLEVIGAMTTLKHLEVKSCRMQVQSVTLLGALSNLTKLVFLDNSPIGVTHKLWWMTSLVSLASLNIDHVAEHEMEALCGALQNLTNLHLRVVGSRTFKHIEKLPKLSNLVCVCGFQDSSKYFGTIEKLTSLTTLQVSKDTTDEDLKTLANHTQLTGRTLLLYLVIYFL